MRQNNNDLLSPDSSPKTLNAAGVKRVNNMPLVIATVILTVFVVLIALVAQKRANAQNQVTAPVTLNAPKKNTLSLAYEIVGDHKSGMIEEPASPLLEPENMIQQQALEDQSVLDTEIERIRQEKTQDFEEAVKAKTSIMIDNTRLNSRESTKGSEPMPQTLGGEDHAGRWHLNSQLESPNSRYELRAGGVIPGVMISGISSELPGQIIGQVSQDVYDTATGKYLLIPQGTKLVGMYSNDVSFGQNSVLVAWQRLVFPDGKALDIGSMSGADAAGAAGFSDQVDHHYLSVYGSALLMSGIVAGMTYSQYINQSNQIGYNQPTAGSVLSQALGQQLGEVSSQLIAKHINVSPSIHIRPGYRFNVIVVKDLTFQQPYRPFVY